MKMQKKQLYKPTHLIVYEENTGTRLVPFNHDGITEYLKVKNAKSRQVKALRPVAKGVIALD